MTRRQFLQITVAVTIASSTVGARWLFESRPVHVLANPSLLRFLDDRRIREIGSAYRRECPHENDPKTLSSAIVPNSSIFNDSTSSHLQSYLDQQVKNDFTRGHTTQINGWILSVTEARQCALFSTLYS